jgi:hypothetical protein
MKFWEYNRNKVLIIALVSFLGFFMLFVLLSRSGDIPMGYATIASVVLAGFYTFVEVVRGQNHFRVMTRTTQDTSERSIRTLFDDGYNVVLQNDSSSLFFTTERLKGDIEGFPVVVSFSQGSRASWPSLVFSFYPLAHASLGNRTSRYLSFKMTLRNRLKKDIKPDVRQFIADLKAKGYTSAEYSQYFVTAN